MPRLGGAQNAGADLSSDNRFFGNVPNPALGAPSRHVRLAAVSSLHLGVATGRRCVKKRRRAPLTSAPSVHTGKRCSLMAELPSGGRIRASEEQRRCQKGNAHVEYEDIP